MCIELAAVQRRAARRVRRKARIFSSVTHLGRWAWLTGRQRERKRERERVRDRPPLGPLCAQACKAAFTSRETLREESSWIWFVWFFLGAVWKRPADEEAVASYRIRSLSRESNGRCNVQGLMVYERITRELSRIFRLLRANRIFFSSSPWYTFSYNEKEFDSCLPRPRVNFTYLSSGSEITLQI